MKRILFLFVILLLPFFSIAPISAQEIQRDEKVVLAANKTINNDYFATGESVTLSGIVNGDAYVAGGDILIDGTINGDLLVTGGNITVRGTVANNIRAMGGNIIVTGDVGGNITVLGGNVQIPDGATIKGSLVAATGSLQVFAPLGRGATIAAGEAKLGNTVNGDITAGVGNLTLTQGAEVNGNLNYWAEETATISQNASVAGKVTYHQHNRAQEEAIRENAQGIFFGIITILAIIGFIFEFILGLLFIYLLPIATVNATNIIRQHSLRSGLIGLLAIILTPILAILLMITIIGIPLGLLLIFGLMFALCIGKILIAYTLGQWVFRLFKTKTHNAVTLLVGLILLFVVGIVPVIGGLVIFIAMLVGLGTLLTLKKQYYKDLRVKKVI